MTRMTIYLSIHPSTWIQGEKLETKRALFKITQEQQACLGCLPPDAELETIVQKLALYFRGYPRKQQWNMEEPRQRQEGGQ